MEWIQVREAGIRLIFQYCFVYTPQVLGTLILKCHITGQPVWKTESDNSELTICRGKLNPITEPAPTLKSGRLRAEGRTELNIVTLDDLNEGRPKKHILPVIVQLDDAREEGRAGKRRLRTQEGIIE